VVYTKVDLIILVVDVTKKISFKLCDVLNVTVRRVWSSKECEVVKEVGRGVGVLQCVALFNSRGAVSRMSVMA